MTRRKNWLCVWTLVLILVTISPLAYSRPSDAQNSAAVPHTPSGINASNSPITSKSENSASDPSDVTTSRKRKPGLPVIGEALKNVANQLLEANNSNKNSTVIEDTRIPPKVKLQVKNKDNKLRTETSNENIENSHAGIAVPISLEDIENEKNFYEISKETSTTQDGISTWVLLSNPASSTLPPAKITNNKQEENLTELEDKKKKIKVGSNKNKIKKPQPNQQIPVLSKRPLIASNKSDLIAGGSAVNENVLNKIKETVLANVQKNASQNRTTPSTTAATTTESLEAVNTPDTKKDVTTASWREVTTKIMKLAELEPTTEKTKSTKKRNKNKNKNKNKTTPRPETDSALLPMEPKEQEIELEVSTPPTTTKKPSRTVTKKKKSKPKKKKTTTPKPVEQEKEEDTTTKVNNKTKVTKPAKKPSNPISTQIFSYLSREVMPTVGVGIVGLAGLVGLASYFLYPFATPVRRTLEVDKKDDLYRHNAEEYANDGNGQAEEEMLGTVLAGMPASSKKQINPYFNQTPQRLTTREPQPQNIRYRHVVNDHSNGYNMHYPQQKTGLAHGAIYNDHVKYNPYERHSYSQEVHAVYPEKQPSYEGTQAIYPEKQPSYEGTQAIYPEKQPTYEGTQAVYPEKQPTYEGTQAMYPDSKNSYSYSAVEPIYAAPQTGPSSYGSDSSNSGIYRIDQSHSMNFEPVYQYEGQVYSESTSNPMPFPSTSMYLGSNSESEDQESKYEEPLTTDVSKEPQFVVGNVPKDIMESATPVAVPEHGPRKLRRRRRNIAQSLEKVLLEAKKENKDIFISNEIDEALGIKPELSTKASLTNDQSVTTLSIIPKVSISPTKGSEPSALDSSISNIIDTKNNEVDAASKPEVIPKIHPTEVVESISTVPFITKIEDIKIQESDESNKVDYTTSNILLVANTSPNPITVPNTKSDAEIEKNGEVTQTTSEMPMSSTTDIPYPIPESTKSPTDDPNTLIYPSGEGSLFTFLKRLIQFKIRLGMSILQTTSESLTRYLKSMDGTMQRLAKASEPRRS